MAKDDDVAADRLAPLVLAAVGQIPNARTRRVHDLRHGRA